MGYTGDSVIYTIDNTTNLDGTVVLSNPQTFTFKDAALHVCVPTGPTPQFATITVFIAGEQTAPSCEYVTAPSDTSIPDLIHCGKQCRSRRGGLRWDVRGWVQGDSDAESRGRKVPLPNLLPLVGRV